MEKIISSVSVALLALYQMDPHCQQIKSKVNETYKITNNTCALMKIYPLPTKYILSLLVPYGMNLTLQCGCGSRESYFI